MRCALCLFLLWAQGCSGWTFKEKRVRSIRVTSSPPNAAIYKQTNWQETYLGQSPVSFEQPYEAHVYRPNYWTFAFGVLGVLVGGFGVVYGSLEIGDNKTLHAVGGYGGALLLVPSLIVTGVVVADMFRSGRERAVFEPFEIRAAATGYMDSKVSIYSIYGSGSGLGNTRVSFEQAIDRGIEVQLQRPTAEEERRTVNEARSRAREEVLVVFDIHVTGDRLPRDTALMLTDLLRDRLVQIGGYRVVPRFEVLQRLRALKAESLRDCYDERCQIEVGKELAANYTLVSKVHHTGAQCVISMQLYELRSETVSQAASVYSGCSAGALTKAIDGAIREISSQ